MDVLSVATFVLGAVLVATFGVVAGLLLHRRPWWGPVPAWKGNLVLYMAPVAALMLIPYLVFILFGRVPPTVTGSVAVLAFGWTVGWWWPQRHLLRQLLRPLPNPAILWIFRGLPGSGKTTAAQKMVRGAMPGLCRVNRDDLGLMLHNGRQHRKPWREETEWHITLVQEAAIEALLRAQVSVVCCDTNLRDEHVKWLGRIAQRTRAAVSIIDLRHTPLQTCLERNDLREGAARLDPDIIRAMYDESIAGFESKG